MAKSYMTISEEDALMNEYPLRAYNVSLLCCKDNYLLLQRSATKSFAPLMWTGIGGSVEATEFETMRSAALRELEEESGLTTTSVQDYQLRRVLMLSRPDGSLTVLFYFTGELGELLDLDCDEGELHWVKEDALVDLDIIPSTKAVLPDLIKDRNIGASSVRLGVSKYKADSDFDVILWTS